MFVAELIQLCWVTWRNQLRSIITNNDNLDSCQVFSSHAAHVSLFSERCFRWINLHTDLIKHYLMIVGFMETVLMLTTTTTCFRDETAPWTSLMDCFHQQKEATAPSPGFHIYIQHYWSWRPLAMSETGNYAQIFTKLEHLAWPTPQLCSRVLLTKFS